MYNKQFDLHLHTFYSDGKESPERVLNRAKKAGLRLVSITDHNSCSHIKEEMALADRLKLNYLSGIELSCVYENRHIHVLGYKFDYNNPELLKLISDIQIRRKAGILTIAKKLRKLGFEITEAELLALPTQYYGLTHIIHCLLEKPTEKRRLVKEVGSTDLFAIINHYFTHAQEAYVPEYYMAAIKVIKLIKKSGGVVCLAHPGSHLTYREDNLIKQLAACGLDALEVFTPKHDWDQIVHYEILARRLKLAITVGSNFHEDFHEQDIPVVTPIGFLKTPPEIYDGFIKFLESRTKFRIKY